MVQIHFIDTEDYSFSAAERAVIERTARAAAETARSVLPLAGKVHLLVEPSSRVLDSTGDNAYTMESHLIRWRVDPDRNVEATSESRLAKSFLHEAYHAARFRHLKVEAGSTDWMESALGEGLATVFARDIADAHEEWADYDPGEIEAWARELCSQPFDSAALSTWKFAHPDGREWIAFRVGTWLVDRICAEHKTTPADLVWVPARDIERKLPGHLSELGLLRPSPGA